MTTGVPPRSLLVFRAGKHICALACEQVREIVSMAAIVSAPGLPRIVEGFLNLRGEAVPFVPLRRLFSLPETEPDIHTPVIIVRWANGSMGLIVDGVDDVIAAESESFRGLPEDHSLNGCAAAYLLRDGKGIVLLDFERLLLLEEKKRLSELRQAAQLRLEELNRVESA